MLLLFEIIRSTREGNGVNERREETTFMMPKLQPAGRNSKQFDYYRSSVGKCLKTMTDSKRPHQNFYREASLLSHKPSFENAALVSVAFWGLVLSQEAFGGN